MSWDAQQYARYLLTLIEEEPDEDEEINEDGLFGYFQSFMPSGGGVERVFEPLSYGGELLKRIQPIYEMLDPADFEGEGVPGYFNGGQADAGTEQLTALGRQLTADLSRLFAECMEPEEGEEAAELLNGVTEYNVLAPGKIEEWLEDREEIVWETLFDLIQEHSDDSEPIAILGEAYYSIACDYWVSYYLQWPRYWGLQQHDPLKAYFELYRLGYLVSYNGTKMLIGRR